MKRVEFEGFGQCVRLANDTVEVLVTTDFGPRVISYRLLDGENVLGLCADNKIDTGDGVYSIQGGHRLWIAPEDWPKTYAADDDAVEVSGGGLSATFVQNVEPISQTQKRMTVTLAESGSEVTVDHEVVFLGDGEVELAPWALTIMRGGGEVVLPNEPFAAHGSDRLLPVRTMSLWSYTQLHDPRFTFEPDAIRVKIDEQFESQQKIGVLNKLGVCHYELPDAVFTKKYGYEAGAKYPDMGVNTEIFACGGFVEIETLAGLRVLRKGEPASHREVWSLAKRS